MRIAVVNEVSACEKNSDIVVALKGMGHEITNAGMTDPAQKPQLTYIHTGLMAALLLNTGAADMVIGGCGTGQGFLNSAMQYPGIFCGLIQDSLDAWLFSRINGGNCISLALNKGYGWGSDIQLRYIFEKLLTGERGMGYPENRRESQMASRLMLSQISAIAHRPLEKMLSDLPPEVTAPLIGTRAFMDAIRTYGKADILTSLVLSMKEK